MARTTLIPMLALALGGTAVLASPAEARHGRWSNAPVVVMDNGYGAYGSYGQNGRGYRTDHQYRGQRGYRDGYRCDRGTGGTIIGAIAGGLLGHEVAGRRGDRTMGVIIGAGVGAVAGRAIDRSSGGNRC
jgi:hypothetical protein